MFQKIKNLFQVNKKEFSNDFSPIPYGLFETNPQINYITQYKTWAFACINAIAETLANQDHHFLKNKWWKEITSPLYDLITPKILQEITGFLKLTGTAYVYKIKPTENKIDRLEILRTDLVFPEYDSNWFISFYRYSAYATQIIIKPEDLIVFKAFTPLASYTIEKNWVWEMEAISLEADIDNKASVYNRNFFKNNATPWGILSTDKDLDQPTSQRLLNAWNSKFKGIENSSKTAILSWGLKYQQVTISQKDMELVEQRKFTRDEILGIFKVPKSILWLSETVNVWNVKAFDNTFKTYAIQPLATYIASVFNATLFKNIWYFEFVNIVPLDDEALEKDLNNGAITINEYRVKKGMPTIEGWDILKLNPTFIVEAWKVQNQEVKEIKPIKIDKKYSNIAKKILQNVKGTEEYNQKKWEEKIKRNDNYEKLYTDALLKIFNLQEKDILKQFAKKTIKAEQLQLKFDESKYLALYHLLLKPIQDDLVKKEWTIAFEEINLNDIFKIWDPKITKWLYENIDKYAKEIDSTTKTKLIDELNQGLQEGLWVSEITTNIKNIFNELKTIRLANIVRTETIRAWTYATLTARDDSEVVEAKEWYTALDERVCPYCNKMHGKTIKLKDDFFKKWDTFKGEDGTTIKLDYENIKGSPLHPSCRCSIIPIIKN